MYTVHILYKMYPAPVYDCIRLIRLVVPLDSSKLLRMGHPTPPPPHHLRLHHLDTAAQALVRYIWGVNFCGLSVNPLELGLIIF